MAYCLRRHKGHKSHAFRTKPIVNNESLYTENGIDAMLYLHGTVLYIAGSMRGVAFTTGNFLWSSESFLRLVQRRENFEQYVFTTTHCDQIGQTMRVKDCRLHSPHELVSEAMGCSHTRQVRQYNDKVKVARKGVDEIDEERDLMSTLVLGLGRCEDRNLFKGGRFRRVGT